MKEENIKLFHDFFLNKIPKKPYKIGDILRLCFNVVITIDDFKQIYITQER